MKRRKAKRKLTDKQALIIIISVLCAVALLIGALVLIDLLSDEDPTDPHAGHNHAAGEECTDTTTDPHAGHNHAAGEECTDTINNSSDKAKYQIYKNADNTYRVVFRDADGKTLKEENNIPKQPIPETLNADKGAYALSWATGDGPNDFMTVYYNVLTGQVSDTFPAARGCDGVRVAYGSEDQTKIIVQDLFDKEAYYKEYTLENAYTKGDDIIISGRLQADNKTVVISYFSGGGDTTQHTTVNLYE